MLKNRDLECKNIDLGLKQCSVTILSPITMDLCDFTPHLLLIYFTTLKQTIKMSTGYKTHYTHHLWRKGS